MNFTIPVEDPGLDSELPLVRRVRVRRVRRVSGQFCDTLPPFLLREFHKHGRSP